jgi:hypothetical protein
MLDVIGRAFESTTMLNMTSTRGEGDDCGCGCDCGLGLDEIDLVSELDTMGMLL